MSSNSAVETRKKQIWDRINDYTVQRVVSHSFDQYVKQLRIGKLTIEPPLTHVNDSGLPDHFPDLLFSSGYSKVIIDIKAVRSYNEQTYWDRVDEVMKYAGKLEYDGEEFEAELVACCPKRCVREFKPPKDITVIGYEIEDGSVTLGPVTKRLANSELRELFSDRSVVFPIGYGGGKFLREEPPLAYTVEIIYSILYSASDYDIMKPDLRRTDMNEVRRQLKSAFPAYLRSSTGDLIPQIADGRLSKALDFLQRHAWIRRRSDSIELFTNKGQRSGNLLETFVKMQAEDEYAKFGDRIVKEVPVDGRTLDSFRPGGQTDESSN